MTPQPVKKGLSVVVIVIIVVAIAFAACGCVGILAAIAVPNFMKFSSRAKQSECKTELKAAYTAERTYFAEKDTYTENTEQLQFTPSGPRSVLLFGLEAQAVGNGPEPQVLTVGITAHSVSRVGLTGHCPNCTIVIGCAANIDGDSEVDVWSISTGDRKGRKGQKIPAGIPYNDYSDLLDAPGD